MIPLILGVALGGPLYVQASLLNAREAPRPDAAVAAWLRIGTAVDIAETQGEWVRVTVAGRPEAHPVQGWVKARYLDESAPTVESLSKEADEKTRTQRIRALQADIRLEGTTLLAACTGGRAEFLGEIRSDGLFLDRSVSKPTPSGLMDLSAHHWTEVRPDGTSAAIVGSPFVHPFRTERWNEADVSAYAPGSCLDLCDGDSHVILGPCEVEGALFTSHPAKAVRPEQVGLSESVVWTTHEEEGNAEVQDWVITRGERTARFTLDEPELGAERPQTEPVRSFFRIEGVGLFGIAPARRPTVRGWVLLELGERVREHRLYLEGWGC